MALKIKYKLVQTSGGDIMQLKEQVGILIFEMISSGDNPCVADADGVELSSVLAISLRFVKVG